ARPRRTSLMKALSTFAAVLTLGVTACNGDSTGLQSPSGTRRSAVSPARGILANFDDDLRGVSSQIPGFAGIFIDSTGMLTVSLTHDTMAPEAVAQIARAFLDVHPSQLMGPSITKPGVNIRHVKYDF